VISYTKLLTGDVLAQRTIDKLNLNMSPAQLLAKVTASAPTDTVLVDVTVLDSSPARARDIANTMSDEFVLMAAGLETPADGLRPTAQVIVQQHADAPADPISPRKKRILAVAAMLGVVIGVCLAIIRDRLDRTVRKLETVERAAGVGVIGEIPFQTERRQQPLISFKSDRSAVAEAFRALRINLRSLEVADGSRIVVVASPMPDEGRTTTAINLALALVEADQNVVVVDGDLRRPRVASYFDLDEETGLSTVLGGGVALGEALKETRVPNLTALPSGGVPDNPTELLESPRAKSVLDELGKNFDYVIVDSPPMLVTDAAILAGNAQGVLLIARFGQTTSTQLAHAADALNKAGAPLLGAVVTMAPTNKRKSAGASYYLNAQQNSRTPDGRGRRRAGKK
jgi:receptor protein-tyrosine kinase